VGSLLLVPRIFRINDMLDCTRLADSTPFAIVRR
jgi:hypothetical protein